MFSFFLNTASNVYTVIVSLSECKVKYLSLKSGDSTPELELQNTTQLMCNLEKNTYFMCIYCETPLFKHKKKQFVKFYQRSQTLRSMSAYIIAYLQLIIFNIIQKLVVTENVFFFIIKTTLKENFEEEIM